MKIILASASPRRRQLLSLIIPRFDVLVPLVDETHTPGEGPMEFTARVSREKMDYILASLEPGKERELIITSDTIVTIDDLILGKPSDFTDAMKKISLLNGRTHRVVTGMTLCVRNGSAQGPGTMLTALEATEVTFRNLSSDGLKEYLHSIEYMDKAGAYAFQENGRMIVESFRGSVTNVIGFPLRLLFRMLHELDITGPVLLQ